MTTTAPRTERPGYRESHRRLAAAQKTRKGGPAYSIYVNRPLGRRAAALAHVIGARPNQVTGVSALFSFAGIALLATGPAEWLTGVAVTAALVIGYALDAADGQLARLRGGGSVAGEWLDHMVDSAKIASLHAAVVVHLHRATDVETGWLALPLTFGIVATVLFFAQLLNEQLRRGRVETTAPTNSLEVRSTGSALLAVLKLPHDYGFFCFAFVLLGSTDLFLAVYAFFLAGNTAYLLAASVKWFRDMDALDRAS